MRFVILHGTGGDHTENWFEWLGLELKKLGHEVWIPDLPDANKPNITKYNQFFINSGYDFNDAVVIGHSSGAVAINGLLQAFNIKLKAAIYVGVFKGDLDWEDLKDIDISFDFPLIRSRSEQRIIIHSDNDPYCPIDDAIWVAQQIDAEFILLPQMGHFSVATDPVFTQFPELLTLIQEKIAQ